MKKQAKRLIIKMTEEPVLEDCPYCKGAHLAGTVDRCPLAPKNTKAKPTRPIKPAKRWNF